MPGRADTTPMLPGLSPICGRPIEARFDGALMSSDGGLLVLREIEQRLGIARCLAACIVDPRASDRIVHGLDEIIRLRMLMIAAGYKDGNDADSLRTDPLFKLAMDRLPDHAELCSQLHALQRPELGSLRPGSVGGATIISIREGEFPLEDVVGEFVTGSQKIVSEGVVVGGRWWHQTSSNSR